MSVVRLRSSCGSRRAALDGAPKSIASVATAPTASTATPVALPTAGGPLRGGALAQQRRAARPVTAAAAAAAGRTPSRAAPNAGAAAASDSRRRWPPAATAATAASSNDEYNLDTLTVWLLRQEQAGNVDMALLTVITSIASACKQISALVTRAPVAGLIGLADAANASGDEQKKLDLVANDIFTAGARARPD